MERATSPENVTSLERSISQEKTFLTNIGDIVRWLCRSQARSDNMSTVQRTEAKKRSRMFFGAVMLHPNECVNSLREITIYCIPTKTFKEKTLDDLFHCLHKKYWFGFFVLTAF